MKRNRRRKLRKSVKEKHRYEDNRMIQEEDLEKEIDTEKNEKQKKKEDIELFKKCNAR